MEVQSMQIERIKAEYNDEVFKVKPIERLINKETKEGLWIDPLAGNSKIGVTNDINPKFNTNYHKDVLEFLKDYEDNSVDGVLFNPPSNPADIKKTYDSIGKKLNKHDASASFYSDIKKEISRVLKPNGKVITVSENSGGCGAKNGFEIQQILMVMYGDQRNDTFCVVDRKVD